MHEGISIQPWNQPQVTPLVISILVLVGLWILQVGFPREARRMIWAWSKPRSIASRNASETPRTFGVALSHALAYFGMVAGILTVFKTSEWTPPWWVPALWLASLAVLKWIGSKLAFGATDLARMPLHAPPWLRDCWSGPPPAFASAAPVALASPLRVSPCRRPLPIASNSEVVLVWSSPEKH